MTPSLYRFAPVTFLIIGLSIGWAQQVVVSPAQANQGASVTLHMSGFTMNSQLTIQIDGVTINNVRPYTDSHGSVDRAVTIPLGLSNGTHRILVSDVYGKRAEANVSVGGNYNTPTMKLQPLSGPAGTILSIAGENWERRSKSITLDDGHGHSQQLDVSDRCYLDGPGGGTEGCRTGQLYLVSQIPKNAQPGIYTVTVSDGFGRGTATFTVTGGTVTPPGPGPNPGPTPKPGPGPAPQPGDKTCDPNIPSYSQPGCSPGGSTGPGTGSNPKPAPAPQPGQKFCDPNVPRYSQPGCVERK